MKIVFLVGLPGSGKTFLGNELSQSDGQFIDDISLPGQFDQLEKAIDFLVPKVFIADVFLCREVERTKAVSTIKRLGIKYKAECEIEWLFFETAPEKCIKNVEKRADGRAVTGLIQTLTKEYTIPKEINPIPVHAS